MIVKKNEQYTVYYIVSTLIELCIWGPQLEYKIDLYSARWNKLKVRYVSHTTEIVEWEVIVIFSSMKFYSGRMATFWSLKFSIWK